MSVEDTIEKLLAPLVSDRVYPDTTPDRPAFPLIIYQQVGGSAGWYVDGTMPDHKNARLQLHVWAKTRTEASDIARRVENTICASHLVARPFGAFVSTYNDVLKIYGTRQDFGISYLD